MLFISNDDDEVQRARVVKKGEPLFQLHLPAFSSHPISIKNNNKNNKKKTTTLSDYRYKKL
jgi:hypothetical protein